MLDHSMAIFSIQGAVVLAFPPFIFIPPPPSTVKAAATVRLLFEQLTLADFLVRD